MSFDTKFPLVNILLVEDDDVAAEAVVRSLKKADLGCPVVVAVDGVEALEVLRAEHDEKSISEPMVILLDLNMPRMDGFQFLNEVRNDPALKNRVVFVLTTSDLGTDRLRAYENNVAGYMVKSAVGPQFAKLAGLLKNYRTAVVLPGDT